MNDRKKEPAERSDKQKAIEIIIAVVAGIFLILGMSFQDSKLKMIFCALALAVGGCAFLVVLIKEIVSRIKNRKTK